jgi:uncharacterized protein (DUF1330 family)
MAHYSVISATPTSEEWLSGYLAAVGPLVLKHGGKYLARTASHELLEGDAQGPALWVLLEWPSKEAESAFHNDPEYVPHRRAREAGGRTMWASIAGQDDLA